MNIQTITVLDEFNYDHWSIQMRYIFEKQHLWSIVSGEYEESTAEFNSMNKKAMTIMMLCINSVEICYVRLCPTAAIAWKTLKEMNELKENTIFRNILGLTMHRNGQMKDFFEDFDHLHGYLSDIEIELSEDLCCILLLSKLCPAVFDVIKAYSPEKDLRNFNTLKYIIINMFKMINKNKSECDSPGEKAELNPMSIRFGRKLANSRYRSFFLYRFVKRIYTISDVDDLVDNRLYSIISWAESIENEIYEKSRTRCEYMQSMALKIDELHKNTVPVVCM